ncbi:MAG: DUF4011 domain-containing protein [Bacteroidaceae bacterium]|nr:DUF4011 domain-containing protein [Bacteroidaceae bacterium]
MDHITDFNNGHQGSLRLDYLPCVNYSMLLNKVNTCNLCEVENHENADWRSVKVEVKGDFLKSCVQYADCIQAHQRIQLSALKVEPIPDKLLNMTEMVDTTFTLTITSGEDVLLVHDFPISLMAYDQWTGSTVRPELLASFVTPNHPLISRVIVNASKYMEKWTGSSAMDEYQTQDRHRARLQVAAIYEALRKEALVYVAPPASFEPMGQRVRLADRVLSEKLATCLDSTLLFASCLESVGLFPILVLLKGHIFLGAWLTEDIYAQNVGDDASFLLKKCADGVNDIVLVETTSLTSSDKVTFDDAVRLAVNALKDEERFQLFIDVHRCRLSNVRPLPQRIEHNGQWIVDNEGVKHDNATDKVEKLDHYALKIDEDKRLVTKQTIWERKLLDFSLRNNLINTKLGKRIIPFVSFGIEHVEDELQEGKSFSMQPFPKTQLDPTDGGMYDSTLQAADLEALTRDELKNKRLISYLSDTELKNAVKFLYRTARTAMEENGANSLFLALGMLKWYESEKSVQPRYAPILLLPVDLVRKGGETGYVIRSRDEDMILNITLIELLKQQFSINLKALDPLPTDEHGVDVKQVFAAIRQFLSTMKRWNVLEETMLGLFSFSKFVMWNDIHSNAVKLKQNPVIATLMENKLKWHDTDSNIDARVMDRTIKPQRYAIPLDVDSSQMEAVVDSGDGKSFILHGPPGTGKSQTITNMIANALYQGKRVLFVAEKMAALEVVQKRLKKIGLDPFCLEMHSNKMTKQHFLAQMQMALEVTHIKSPKEYESTANQLFEHRQAMIGNVEALHKVHPMGLSLFDCISRYLSIKYEELSENLPDLKTINVEKLNQWEASLLSLNAVFQLIGHPMDSPLMGLEPNDARLETTNKVKEVLKKYSEVFTDFKQSAEKFAPKLLHSGTDDSMRELEGLLKFTNALQNAYVVNDKMLKLAADNDFRKDFPEVISAGRKRDMLKQQLLHNCTDNVLDIQVGSLQEEWEGIQKKWFLPRFFAKRSFMGKMRAYNANLKPDDVNALLKDVDDYQQNAHKVSEHLDVLKDAFNMLATDKHQDWTKIEQSYNAAPTINQFLVDYANRHDMSFGTVKGTFLQKLDDLTMFKQQYQEEIKELQNLSMLHEQQKSYMATFARMTLPVENISRSIPDTLERWLLNFDQIKDWCQWVSRKRELENENLQCVCDYIEQEHKDGNEAAQALLKGIYHQLILRMVDEDDALRMFNGMIFSDLIEKYRQETSAFQELTKKELYCRLAANVPSQIMEAAANSEMGILKRNIANGGRGTTIRKIIDQIPTLLPRLCPCMLMSPISVAQYIDLDKDKFDIVVFDEASQMPTSEAVGAIARGKSLVVVGDPMQMPPTSFFATSAVDEEEAEIDDMDSILDDCITLSIPSRYLTWHYRSKHESLIAFSNTQYYDGKLFTFPSIDDRVSKVSLVQIEGTYDKGRTRSNPAEAKAIVEEVIRRLSDAELSKFSIGIVSFSKVQQSLIEDYLDEEMARHPELELQSNASDEPIFIKNLENVQGDERDVILFSVGYGPDKNGHVSINFGPLNNEGGERRLNVAVSRARYEMMVFSTLRAEQIDLRRSNAKGVVGLKKFLEFAAMGMQALPTINASQLQASEIINDLAEQLQKHGYQVDKMVGKSGFRIDLGVIDPRDPDKYLMGILTDGKSYYNTKTTRDREICQPNVLKMLNWNFMRVWSVDWFQDHDKVLRRILEKLYELQHPEKRSKKPEDKLQQQPAQQLKLFSIADEPVSVAVNEHERVYKTANIRPSTAQPDIERVIKHSQKVSDQLRQIITVEQPVTNNYLYKRIATLWNMPRVTPRLQTLVDSLLTGYYLDPTSDGKVMVYWIDKVVASGYTFYRVESKRDISEVPLIELMNAALYVVEQQISIPREDLKKVVANLLGFSRKGVNVDAAAERAIQLLIQQGKLKEEIGRIVLNSNN